MLAKPSWLRARPAFAAAVLGLCCGSLCACTTVQELGGEPTEKQDNEARRAHYEESAQAYYEGGKYERAVQQWKKVLELTPDDQKAKWGLAKSYAQIGTTQSLRMARDLYEQIIDRVLQKIPAPTQALQERVAAKA